VSAIADPAAPAPRPDDPIAALRARLAEVAPAPAAVSEVVATGLAALDRVLMGGGLPRGRITECVGAPGSGVTTLVRAVVRQAVTDGVRTAVVDGSRTLYARDWVMAAAAADGTTDGCARPATPLTPRGGPVFVRPPTPDRAAWCADLLLRCGAFALVVLDGAPPLPRAVSVRLAQLARESDAVLLVTGDAGGATRLGGSVRLRLHPAPPGRAPGGRFTRPVRSAVVPVPHALHVAVEKGGVSPCPVEVSCVVPLARRLCAHPAIPDRRGVDRGRAPRGGRLAERGVAGGAATGAAAPRPGHAAVPAVAVRRGRRCAEPRLAQGRFGLGDGG
jgi:hypothetical protein